MCRAVLLGLWLAGVWGGAAAQDVQILERNMPVALEAFTLEADSAAVDLSIRVRNTAERRVVAVAVGVVMVDAFDDAIGVHYARWTDDLAGLGPGQSATLTDSLVELRADDLFLAVPFVYAVRFADGEVRKVDLSSVSTELLSRFEVAASSSTLQP